MAAAPSGVKYMLYGSWTGIRGPFAPVVGSIGVTVLPTSSVAYSVRMSHDGTTCCSSRPAGNRPTTAKVAGSISQTSPLLCGTYTMGFAARAASLSIPTPVAAYTLPGSVTGGIPGSPSTACGTAEPVTGATVRPFGVGAMDMLGSGDERSDGWEEVALGPQPARSTRTAPTPAIQGVSFSTVPPAARCHRAPSVRRPAGRAGPPIPPVGSGHREREGAQPARGVRRQVQLAGTRPEGVGAVARVPGAVLAVAGVSGVDRVGHGVVEEQLGGEHGRSVHVDLDVQVRDPGRVPAGVDGRELDDAVWAGELRTAQGSSRVGGPRLRLAVLVVPVRLPAVARAGAGEARVDAARVGLPQVDHRARDGRAPGSAHDPERQVQPDTGLAVPHVAADGVRVEPGGPGDGGGRERARTRDPQQIRRGHRPG